MQPGFGETLQALELLVSEEFVFELDMVASRSDTELDFLSRTLFFVFPSLFSSPPIVPSIDCKISVPFQPDISPIVNHIIIFKRYYLH